MTLGSEVIEILMVDDSMGDVELAIEALAETDLLNRLHVAQDGVEALAFLRQHGAWAGAPRPDLILLDLNLPKKDGREVLAEIKADPILRQIPVVILTTSQAELDIRQAYELRANCYIAKPVDLATFMAVMQSIKDFWFTVVKLPRK